MTRDHFTIGKESFTLQITAVIARKGSLQYKLLIEIMSI